MHLIGSNRRQPITPEFPGQAPHASSFIHVFKSRLFRCAACFANARVHGHSCPRSSTLVCTHRLVHPRTLPGCQISSTKATALLLPGVAPPDAGPKGRWISSRKTAASPSSLHQQPGHLAQQRVRSKAQAPLPTRPPGSPPSSTLCATCRRLSPPSTVGSRRSRDLRPSSPLSPTHRRLCCFRLLKLGSRRRTQAPPTRRPLIQFPPPRPAEGVPPLLPSLAWQRQILLR